MSDEVKITKNISDEVINFENKEEFFKYYEEHKEDVDKMKTRGLNIKFKIPGFKIGRKKDELVLIQLKKTKEEKEQMMKEIEENNSPKDEVVKELTKEPPHVASPEPPQKYGHNLINFIPDSDLVFDIIAKLDKIQTQVEKNYQLLEGLYVNSQNHQLDMRSINTHPVNMNERPGNTESVRFNNSFRGYL